jgi:ribosome-binding protein aMBF1 (putative translation factor)
MRVKKYLGRLNQKCEMCGSSSYGHTYLIVGQMTDAKLEICMKCAKRETGGKRWEARNQQLKKLSQK